MHKVLSFTDISFLDRKLLMRCDKKVLSQLDDLAKFFLSDLYSSNSVGFDNLSFHSVKEFFKLFEKKVTGLEDLEFSDPTFKASLLFKINGLKCSSSTISDVRLYPPKLRYLSLHPELETVDSVSER